MRNQKSFQYISYFLTMIFIILFGVPIVNCANVGDVVSYSPTNSIQVFTAPETGYYQLEGWGSQGYTAPNGYRGGYGAYATGAIVLHKGESIFVTVGNQGNGGMNTGYTNFSNGGTGGAGDRQSYAGAGGSSTHFTTVNKSLAEIGLANKNQILLVAAGGGAGTWTSSNGWFGLGGHGGGIRGNTGGNGIGGFAPGGGGTQTAGGTAGNGGQPGVFGRGGSTNSNGAAGGGGFYGGGTSWGAAGGGGSSYIGNEKLVSYQDLKKAMYCYGCTTSNEDSTYTKSVSTVNGTATVNTPKTGSGYAKVTLLYIMSHESRLQSLTFSHGKLNHAFDPDIYEYSLVLKEEEYDLDITATVMDSKASFLGAGSFVIHSGTHDYNIVVTAEDGTISTYVIHVTRPASSSTSLKDIQVGETSIENFNPSNLEYHITVPTNVETLDLSVLKEKPDQTVHLPEDFTLKTGDNKFEIIVESEDKNHQSTYVLHVFREHSSKLKQLTFSDYNLNETFDSDTLEYSVDIMVSTLALKVNAIPFDEEASIKLEGFGYIKSSGTGKIIVTEPNCESTTYIVKINKAQTVEKKTYDFPYSGKIEEFVVPITGYYQLEAWGAQGYSVNYFSGGFGAYSTGVVKLHKDDVIYINVGNQGKGGASVGHTAYPNGGTGGAGDRVSYAGSGGGSTNITLVPKNIQEIGTSNLSQILMVAAGGGSGTWTSGNGWAGYGGHGGGITGVSAANGIGRFLNGGGATQTSGGSAGYSCSAGVFGHGASSYSSGAGGGGGFYGGGCSWGSGGGGGSSYIANTKLITYKDVTKSTYCYNCATSNNPSTYTVRTNKYSSTPTSNYAKAGAGYARLTMLGQPSENNYLSFIEVESTNFETKVTEKKEYTPSFDMVEENYKLTLDTMETSISIQAETEDASATIEGIGTFEVPAGTTDYPIVVTADSGDVKIYHLEVTRPASDADAPEDIVISGLLPSFCAFSPDFCKLNPEKFDKDTKNYEIRVPGKIKQIWFSVLKAHPFQTVEGEGKVELLEGENNVTIRVTSESGNNTREYHYKVIRDMSMNADLADIRVVDPVREIGFDPDITEYTFSVPNEYTSIGLEIEKSDEHAVVTVEGNENLSVGTNQIIITVTAVSGDVKVYFLNVYREKNGNTYLSSLEVYHGDTEYSMTPTFSKTNTGVYRVVVPNEITEVDIRALPEISTTEVTGIGVKSLNTGVNEFHIVAIAENKDTETYTLEIKREKNSNANLTNISVKHGEEEIPMNPTFHKDVLTYNLEVDSSVTTVDITATPEESTTIYKLLDGKSLKIGMNQKRVMAIAEDGTTKTYTLQILKTASTDNYLKDIILSTGVLDPEFKKEINAYEVQVPNEVTSITITGIKNDVKATVSGNGLYSLIEGENEILLDVQAEDGSIRTYSVTVIRNISTNAYLKDIVLSSGSLEPSFVNSTLEYTVHVPENIDKITIQGIPEHNKTIVSGNGEYELIGGSNLFTLTTLANDKKTKLVYKVHVIKAASSNNYLESLILEEASIEPEFNKETLSYRAKVPYLVTQGTFKLKTEDPKATTKILNNENFVVGENRVTIQVISESNEIREYVVVIERQEDVTNSDYLSSLTVSEGTLIPEFDKENQYYEVNVEHSVTEIEVTGVLEDPLATIEGNGTYSLEVGQNIINVRVTSQDGKIRDYQVIVIREESDEARLSSLSVDGSVLSPNFSPDVYEYSLTTSDENLVIEAIPMEEKAEVVIVGNEMEEPGDYLVIVRVTSPNKKVRKEYLLHVKKEASNNNNLSDLRVLDYTINPEFHASTTLYTLSVGSDVNSIVIEATPEHDKATVTGDGSKKLSFGENQFIVEVTSESGKVKAYTILVTKEGDTSAKLANLIVNNGEMTPEFAPDTLDYDVLVDASETSLDLTVVLESDKASYTVLDNELTSESSKVRVMVTSESGNVTIYVLNVIKKEVVNALLDNITVKNYHLSPIFHRYINTYDLVINYETTQILFTVVPTDANATWKFVGQSEEYVGTQTVLSPSIELGNQTLSIEVTSSDGSEQEIYTIHVLRQKQANDTLSYLYTSEGELTPTFHPKQMEYEITVSEEVETIELFGEPVDKTSTVIGLGEHSLVSGENHLQVSVTTQSGIQRIYYITVIRSKNDDALLKSLIAQVGTVNYELTPKFTKETFDYELTVPVGTQSISISGETNHSLSVAEGFGIYTLQAGENVIPITVTSESGKVQVYTLTIHREKSNNNRLIDLIPSVGELEPEFSYEETNYEIHVDASSSVLSFEAITEYDGAVVSGLDSQVIPDGTSTRTITVTAEDDSIREYVITIYKKREDNAKLSHLEVKDYPFEETFDPSTFVYHITVPNEKKILFESDVIATTEDSNATIKKSGNLNLSTTNPNEYVITVTAPDGFTKQSYKIIITREKGSNALLNNLVVKKGKLETVFQSNVFEYNWLVQKDATLTKEDVIATSQDVNASITKTESITVTVDNDQNYIVTVVSEDRSDTKEYILHPVIDEASDNTELVSLTPSVGSIEYSNDITEYEINVDSETTEISFEAIPVDPKAVVEGTEMKSLEIGENTIIITVTAEDEVTTRTITIKVNRGKAIESIIPSESKILLDIEEEKTITYTLNPEDTTMREVEWISRDESIATVSNGVIKGVSYGTTKVILQSKDKPEVQVEIEVIVLRKKIMSSVYEIKRYSEEEKKEHPEYENYIIGLEPSTKLEEFQNNLENEPEQIVVKKTSGEEIDGSINIGTGYEVELVYEGEVMDQLIIIVRGDINGDGLITTPDYTTMKDYLNRIYELNFREMLAGDTNQDGKVTTPDYTTMKDYLNRLINSVN